VGDAGNILVGADVDFTVFFSLIVGVDTLVLCGVQAVINRMKNSIITKIHLMDFIISSW
jgi:hypothetical protein